jgi:hypothetical protein
VKKVLIAAAAIAATVTAAEARPVYAYQGFGTETCQQFNRFATNKSWVSESHSWAQGFISGMNMAANVNHEDGKDLNSLTVTEQTKILIADCKAHPGDRFMSAVHDLYISLDDYKAVEDSADAKKEEKID